MDSYKKYNKRNAAQVQRRGSGSRPWKSPQEQKYAYKSEVKKPRKRLLNTVCCTCGRTLSRFDNLKGYGHCYPCRRILFPKTTMTREEWRRLNGLGGGRRFDSRVYR